jgi:hypothetical protein
LRQREHLVSACDRLDPERTARLLVAGVERFNRLAYEPLGNFRDRGDFGGVERIVGGEENRLDRRGAGGDFLVAAGGVSAGASEGEQSFSQAAGATSDCGSFSSDDGSGLEFFMPESISNGGESQVYCPAGGLPPIGLANFLVFPLYCSDFTWIEIG